MPAAVVEANIKKVDTTALAAQTSPVKINTGKEITVTQQAPAPEESKEVVSAVTRTGQHHASSMSQKQRPGQQT